MFGHTFELIIVLLVGLLIFGPKRVIEMGSAAGKMLRELRDAMKEMNWSALNGGDEHGSDPLAELRELRDLPRTFASSILNPPPVTAEPPAAGRPPEGTVAPTPAADTVAPPSAPVVESAPHSENGSVPSASTATSASTSSSGGPAAPAEPGE